MAKECPECGLINPASAMVCDCGYRFYNDFDAHDNGPSENHRGQTDHTHRKLHTHYDNLKVARNAPPEIIKAAYKALSQKYHPDKNPDNQDAARIMAIINASYEVLSDTAKRREHDNWIAQQERPTASPPPQEPRPQAPRQHYPGTGPEPSAYPLNRAANPVVPHLARFWVLYIPAALLAVSWIFNEASPPPPGPKPYSKSPQATAASANAQPVSADPLRVLTQLQVPPVQAVAPAYTRPKAAPNGRPWPTKAGYVKGYERLHTDGLSTVTVDNSKNDSDVFVKLVSLSGAQAYPVRQFYIPAFGRFTLNKVRAGTYDVRYRDLGTGGLSRSEAFTLNKTETNNGIRYSNITMTLYKVIDGNMQTYDLAESEF